MTVTTASEAGMWASGCGCGGGGFGMGSSSFLHLKLVFFNVFVFPG